MEVLVGAGQAPEREAVVALIAHDAKKDDLLRLARPHRAALSRFRLIATGTTGRMLH
jgi:methylglyoxal synthase